MPEVVMLCVLLISTRTFILQHSSFILPVTLRP